MAQDDKDPPWFNTKIKSLLQEKKKIYKNFRKDCNNTQLLRKLEHLQNHLNNSVDSSKHNYYLRMANKLNSIQKSSKEYWCLLKSFINNKKMPIIPPILPNNAPVTDFKKKAELFNSYFANQCTLINSNSTLPVNVQYLTDKRLSSFDFSEDDIMKVIQKLDSNKAHGQGNFSIHMIKICGKSIYIPLRKIFEECLRTGTFPLEWKTDNVVPIFKKGDKQIYKNYWPASLLAIFGKILEEMFPFFIENKLIIANQSGFKPGDSCINQLIAITHKIYQSFDVGYEVRGVFLDISKAFDKVWHEDLIFKLKQNGISVKLFNLIKDFLKNRKQRVVLNGPFSSRADVDAGVPQGSILGPLIFLIYINDLTNDLSSSAKLSADDTSLFSVVFNVDVTAKELNDDPAKVQEWPLL